MVHGEDQAIFPSCKPGNPEVLKDSTADLQDKWDWKSNPKKHSSWLLSPALRMGEFTDLPPSIGLSNQNSQNRATSCTKHYLENME